MEGKTDQRGQDIPTGVSMTTTHFSEKILTAGFNAITCILYHKKDCTYYIHKLETPNTKYIPKNEYIYPCK